MTMDATQKAALAAVLGVTWIGLLVWQWGGAQEPVRVPLSNVSGIASAHQRKPSGGGLRVNIEMLAAATNQRDATFTAPRNIFAVSRPDGTLPIGSDVVVPPEAGLDQQVAQQASAVEVAQYKYLGFLRMTQGPDRDKNVAVLSKDEEVVVAKVGDRFEDHLILKAITPDSVVIRDLGAQVEHTLPLSEEPPLQP